MKTKLMLKFVYLFNVCLLLIGLLSPQSMAAAQYMSESSQIIRIQITPGTLDPQIGSFANEVSPLRLLFEGLTKFNKDLEIAEGAADDWYFSNNNLQVTFHIRSGLTYSDGTILNAKRFEYSLLRALDPRLNTNYGSSFYYIVGAENYRTADVGLGDYQLDQLRNAVGIKAIDSQGNNCTSYSQTNCDTLRINLIQPHYDILYEVGLWVAFPAKEEFINAGGVDWWKVPQYLVGNGPFVMTSYSDSGMTFSPNSNFRLSKPIYSIEFQFEGDSAAALQKYRDDELDIITPGYDVLNEIKEDSEISSELFTTPSVCTYGVFFQSQKAPFTDPKVRQAFAYSINRQAFVDDILSGYGNPTLTWIPSGVPGHDSSETRWNFDPVKAVQSLQESTYGSAENLPPIVLTFSDSPRNRTRFQWLADSWQNILGVTSTLNPVDSETYTDLTKDIETAPQIYILGWCGDFPSPMNFLSYYWKSSSSYAQRIGYSNQQVDTLLNLADADMNPETRLNYYEQAQDLIIGDVPGAMVWNSINIALVKNDIHGYYPTPLDSFFPGEIFPQTIYRGDLTEFIFLPLIMRN